MPSRFVCTGLWGAEKEIALAGINVAALGVIRASAEKGKMARNA